MIAAACAVVVAFRPSEINNVFAALTNVAMGTSAAKLITLIIEKVKMKDEMKKYLEEQLEAQSEENSLEGKRR